MTPEQIQRSSKGAYNQWAVQWRANAKANGQFKMHNSDDFAHVGIGKTILCVASGFSFEQQIDVIEKYAYNIDIICCDKTLGHLLARGIKPTYCFVADANVNYERYLKPWESQLDGTILLMNVCGNPQWSMNGNWKNRYFFVFKDILGSEKEFSEISKCPNVITAGTNVSNMMLVAITQCDDKSRQNLFGYDKIALIGYDYSWKPDGKYYAFDDEGGGKVSYMRHIYGLSARGNVIFSSNNLANSASWLQDYITIFKLPVVQCSPDSMLMMSQEVPSLEEQLRYRYKTGDRDVVIQLLREKNHLEEKNKKIHDRLVSIGKKHLFAHLATV